MLENPLVVELVSKAFPGGGLSLVVGKAASLATWTTGIFGNFLKFQDFWCGDESQLSWWPPLEESPAVHRLSRKEMVLPEFPGTSSCHGWCPPKKGFWRC